MTSPAGHAMLRVGSQKRPRGDAIEFSKLAGGGNDFIVVDNRDGVIGDGPELARRLCTRRLSVGSDGLILIENSARAGVRMIYFNPDGTRAFCGNGTRCAARFAFMHVMTPRKMTVETDAGVIPAEVLDHGAVTLTIPGPEKPVEMKSLTTGGGRSIEGCFLTVGVPHFVVQTDRDIWRMDLASVGPLIRDHPELRPDGANADFVLVEDRQSIAMRTWERGVEAETLSCGSGVVAAVVALASSGLVDARVSVLTRSGIRYDVDLEWEGAADSKKILSIRFTGDARLIFESALTADTLTGFDAEWARDPTGGGPRT